VIDITAHIFKIIYYFTMTMAREQTTEAPRVSRDDINAIVACEVIDGLFTQLAHTEPVLARELLARAMLEGKGEPAVNELIVLTGAWVYAVLNQAEKRKQANSA
jgi:hypothetical protein